jgi:predicted Fe-Mo cluster-binding NifX family protein
VAEAAADSIIEKGDIMKIAVTSTGTNLDSQVDPRFGRAAYILIVDSDSFDFEVLDNKENVNAFKGAGIQAASTVSSKGAEVLLTGFCGPNAFKAMNAAKIGVANDAKGTVREAVQAYLDGKLPLADEANVEGHW